jgi:hypothetical protein
MTTPPKSERTFWQKEATRLLRMMVSSHEVSYKQLARRLEHFGGKEPEKTLSNKINRGSFSFAFFLRCMAALQIENVQFYLKTISPETLAAIRNEALRRPRRKFPSKPRVRHVKAPGKANRPR